MVHENMSGEQFTACMEGRDIADGTQTSLFDAFIEQAEEGENAEN